MRSPPVCRMEIDCVWCACMCVRASLCMDARVRASRACVHVCVCVCMSRLCVCMSRLCVCMSRVFSPAQVTVVQRQATRFACVSTDTFSFSPWRLATGLLPACYRLATGLLPACYRLATGLVPACYRLGTGLLPACYRLATGK